MFIIHIYIWLICKHALLRWAVLSVLSLSIITYKNINLRLSQLSRNVHKFQSTYSGSKYNIIFNCIASHYFLISASIVSWNFGLISTDLSWKTRQHQDLISHNAPVQYTKNKYGVREAPLMSLPDHHWRVYLFLFKH